MTTLRKCDSAPKGTAPTNADRKKLPQKKEVVLKGKKITLYSIGWIGLMSNRDPHTIRRYEYRMVLPKPLIASASNQRWYLAEEVAGYANIIKNAQLRTRVNLEHTTLRDDLHNYRAKVKEKLSKDISLVIVALKDTTHDYAQGMRTAVTKHRVIQKLSRNILK